MLVLEHGLLSVILKTLRELLTPCKDPATGCLKLRPNNYKHSRIFYIVYDLRYVKIVSVLAYFIVHAYSLRENLSWFFIFEGMFYVLNLRNGQNHWENKFLKLMMVSLSWLVGCRMLILFVVSARCMLRGRNLGSTASTSASSCNQQFSHFWNGAYLMWVFKVCCSGT